MGQRTYCMLFRLRATVLCEIVQGSCFHTSGCHGETSCVLKTDNYVLKDDGIDPLIALYTILFSLSPLHMSDIAFPHPWKVLFQYVGGENCLTKPMAPARAHVTSDKKVTRMPRPDLGGEILDQGFRTSCCERRCVTCPFLNYKKQACFLSKHFF